MAAPFLLCAAGPNLFVEAVSVIGEPYLSIRWRAVPKVLYAQWKGFATSAEFRAALLTGVHAIREQHVVGYVSDARKAKAMLPEDEPS
jgi:hypothetical protein